MDFEKEILRNGKFCKSVHVADFFEALKISTIMAWEGFDKLKVTPENFDINYIVDNVMYFPLSDSFDKREMELARLVLEVVLSHSNVLYEEFDSNDPQYWDVVDDSEIIKQLKFDF